MTDYRRNFVPGGSFFFTVNLGQRNARLLTEHVGLLRAAFRYTRARHPFAIDAIVVLPDYLHTIWTCPRMTPISPRAGGSSNQGSPAPCRQPSGSPKAACEKASAAFGSGAIGSTPCVTRTTSRGTRITFTLIR